MTGADESSHPESDPARSITAEAAVTAADLMLLVTAGSDPRDEKRSILRHSEDIEITLDALATVTGQLPQILDQLAIFLTDRTRRAQFAVNEAAEAARGADVEPEAVTAAALLARAIPAAQQLAAAVADAQRTITPDTRRRRQRELLGMRRRRGYLKGRRP